jgi:hypothetical protein
MSTFDVAIVSQEFSKAAARNQKGKSFSAAVDSGLYFSTEM